MGNLDFERLSQALLSRCFDYLTEWLPSGKMEGVEYVCGNLLGDPGHSLKINTKTGQWADFEEGSKGGDLISLYAAIKSLNQGDAFKKLADQLGIETLGKRKPTNGNGERKADKFDLAIPPKGSKPVISHAKTTYEYDGPDGETLFYVARFEKDGEKTFAPYSWCRKHNRWVNKSWPPPRPLFGLRELALSSEKRVLIVEGEKACEALRAIDQVNYIVITWPNGTNSVHKTDWSPIHGREILIWPDADMPGVKAAQLIANTLVDHCPEIKILTVMDDQRPKGWDAADAIEEGWDWTQICDWARPRATVFKKIEQEPELEQPLLERPAGPPEQPEQISPLVAIAQDKYNPFDGNRQAVYEQCGLVLKISKNKVPVPHNTLDNVMRVLEGIPKFKDLLWFDEFNHKIFTKLETGKRREWTDIDDINLTSKLQRWLGFLDISTNKVAEAVKAFSHNNSHNEVKEWLETLKWDGEPRVDAFFPHCFGAKPTLYTCQASKNWWISMVARVFKPGCKVDNMIVLEGGQGKFKSTALAVIGGAWYTEMLARPESKDFFETLLGKLIIEVSELDAFSKTEVSTIKRVISSPYDRFRLAYARRAQDFPRQCVFVGTTNESTYLRDSTGARRFWPIRIGEIDIPKIKELREQLFAEATALYKGGSTWWNMPEEETLKVQESRRQTNEAWEEAVSQAIIGESMITTTEIAKKYLGFENESRITKYVLMQIADILKMYGWERRYLRILGRRSWCYVDPKTQEDLQEGS